MNRGEIWWAHMELPSGRRPVVLVSRAVTYKVRDSCTVAEVTTTIRLGPNEVPLGKSDGLERACVINTDNLATIKTAQLEELIGPLTRSKRELLDAALAYSLGLD